MATTKIGISDDGAEAEVEVLGSWASPYSNRVEMALNLKSIPYRLSEERFFSTDDGAKSHRLLRANPVHKKIPVLLHRGRPVCESLIILHYIDDVWAQSGPSILPSHPYDRALARFWAAFLDDKWFPALKEMEQATDEASRAGVVGKILEMTALLEGAFVEIAGNGNSNSRRFFGGDDMGFLDIALGSYLGWVRVLESAVGVKLFDSSTCPGLAGWVDRFCSHPAARDVVPPSEKLVQFYIAIKSQRKAQS
ncbi:glutathione S-transferase U17-like [Andrographis paniculata]|uniref:glutathione S-transferase U17-like n=1 Tax=Andrographis paniculata TaxID=175694 RepID=UPI0021E8C8FD|nr:glutathione S-transferase U17-like [Andrographis paniculata]